MTLYRDRYGRIVGPVRATITDRTITYIQQYREDASIVHVGATERSLTTVTAALVTHVRAERAKQED